jgi:lysophospholipase L1-like esterase
VVVITILLLSVFCEGPALIGERPVNHKDKMLDDYREMNRKVASALSIPFVDVRKELKDAIPSYRLAKDGCVTTDGEHLNNRGVAIISYMFAKVTYDWVQKKEKNSKNSKNSKGSK